MDKLLFLEREIRQSTSNYKCDSTSENKVERHYNRFENKFINQNTICQINRKSETEIQLLSIIEELFYFENKTPIIDFFNSIYCDGWGTSGSAVRYIENNKKRKNESDIVIEIENEYKKVQYKINFKIEDYENLAMIIFRYDLSNKPDKIISLFAGGQTLKKKNNKLEINKINPYIIMLNSNMNVPDILESKVNNENGYSYKFNILKNWKYDLKKMFDENMYLLFPLKIFDLEKRIFNIDDSKSCNLIKYEVARFFREMNNYIEKLKEKGSISQNDIDKFNLISSNLLINLVNKNTQKLSQIDKEFVDSLMITVS